jgi:NADH:ubiquinone oxidoreductase subunit 6 (subunit J)
MDLATLIFWIIAVILVGSALMVVSARNIVHSALALIVVFAMAAGIYLLLNAEFIAIVQILIYAGAVTILILFALMLTRLGTNVESNPSNRQWWLALPICALVGAGIIFAVTLSPHAISNVAMKAPARSAGS